MRRGLYRTFDPILGAAARDHKSSGDAAPYLSRYLSELLDFQPAFESLPYASEFKRRTKGKVTAKHDAETAPRPSSTAPDR